MKPILLFFLFFISSQFLFAQTRDELEKKRKEIQQEIQELQRAQSEISKDKKAGLSQLKLIERKLRSRYAVIENLNDEMKMIDNTIFNDNREIYRLQRELDTLKKQYARTIEYAYKNRSSYDMMNFIFSATSFNDAVRRVSYLKTYRQYRDEQVGNINRTQKELSVKINTLTKDKKDKGKVLLEQNMQKELLESEKKEKNQFVTKLKSREKEIEKEMAAKRKIERSLQSSIAAIVKREIEAARRKAEEDAKKAAAVAVKPVESKPAAASSSAAPVAT
jgi:peptidoglycan hydrolase CwlO-like protein